MDRERAFSIVTTSYYRGVADDVVVAALECLLQMLKDAGWPTDARLGNLLYIFSRIAQLSASARDAMASLQPNLNGRAAEIVRGVLAASLSADFPNALDRKISGPPDLDLLWAEFFVTGSREPVLRLVRTLDNPDGIRRLLHAWLQERSWFGASRRDAAAETLRSHGLVVDLKARRILTDGDLDCACFTLAEHKIPIFRLLPFEIPPADVLNLSVKGAALWSMRLNSCEHDVVRRLCEEEHRQPGGFARRRLMEPIREQKPFAL